MAWALDFEFSGVSVSLPHPQFLVQVDKLSCHFPFPISRFFSLSHHRLAFKVSSFMQGKGNLTSNSTSCVDGTLLLSKLLDTRLAPHLLLKCQLMCLTGQVFILEHGACLLAKSAQWTSYFIQHFRVGIFQVILPVVLSTIKAEVILKFEVWLIIAGQMPSNLRLCDIFSSWETRYSSFIPFKSGCWRSNFHSRERHPSKDEKYKQISPSFWKVNAASTKRHKQNHGSAFEVWWQAQGLLSCRRWDSLWHSEEVFSVWHRTSPANPNPTSGTQPPFSPHPAGSHLDSV